MELEDLKVEANKLGYKLVKKNKEDLLRETNTKCVRCIQFKMKPIGKSIYLVGEKGDKPICKGCYDYVSMW